MSISGSSTATLRLKVNGRVYHRTIPVQKLLADVLREDLGLTGTHLGCEHGVCGACTVLIDGQTARSCTTLAVQVDDSEITTVEGLAPGPDRLHPLQEAFREKHGLQCGYCTSGMLVTAAALLAEHPEPTEEQVRTGIAGNICRCTGYQQIIEAVLYAAQLRRDEAARHGSEPQSQLAPDLVEEASHHA